MVKQLKCAQMEKYIMSNQRGFTMMEMLVVLAITSLVTVFLLPKLKETVRSQEQRHFFTLFESDNLFLQNQMLYRPTYGRINLYQSSYVINLGNKDLIHLTLPEPLHLTTPIYQISYASSGTIRQLYTYRYKYNYQVYRVVYPF